MPNTHFSPHHDDDPTQTTTINLPKPQSFPYQTLARTRTQPQTVTLGVLSMSYTSQKLVGPATTCDPD